MSWPMGLLAVFAAVNHTLALAAPQHPAGTVLAAGTESEHV